MNLSPINYQPNVAAINLRSQNQNTNFKSKNIKPLIKVIEGNEGKLSENLLNNFIKENFGIFGRRKMRKLLSGLPEYITGIVTASAGLLAANDALKTENSDLQTANKSLRNRNFEFASEIDKAGIEMDLTEAEKRHVEMGKICNVLSQMKIPYSIDKKSGLLIIEGKYVNYETVQDTWKNGISSEINFLDYVDTINGDVDLVDSRYMSLDNLTTLNGSLYAKYVNCSAKNLKWIEGSLITDKSSYLKLPNLEHIEKDFRIGLGSSCSTPSLRYVGGDVRISTEHCCCKWFLPSLSYVGGDLSLYKTYLTCPPGLTIMGTLSYGTFSRLMSEGYDCGDSVYVEMGIDDDDADDDY